MNCAPRLRRRLHLGILTAFLVAQFAVLLLWPHSVQAATSADPNDEIVYIDSDGVIRVLDTQGDPLVDFVSPSNGWERLGLADVNDDGDMEILALKESGGTTTVAVFDPVVYKGALDPNKKTPERSALGHALRDELHGRRQVYRGRRLRYRHPRRRVCHRLSR